MQIIESFFCCVRGDVCNVGDTRKLNCRVRVCNCTRLANNCFDNNWQSSAWRFGKSSKRLASQLIVRDDDFRANYLPRITSFE